MKVYYGLTGSALLCGHLFVLVKQLLYTTTIMHGWKVEVSCSTFWNVRQRQNSITYNVSLWVFEYMIISRSLFVCYIKIVQTVQWCEIPRGACIDQKSKHSKKPLAIFWYPGVLSHCIKLLFFKSRCEQHSYNDGGVLPNITTLSFRPGHRAQTTTVHNLSCFCFHPSKTPIHIIPTIAAVAVVYCPRGMAK